MTETAKPGSVGPRRRPGFPGSAPAAALLPPLAVIDTAAPLRRPMLVLRATPAGPLPVLPGPERRHG